MHREAGKEDHAQSSTSEVASLQFNSGNRRQVLLVQVSLSICVTEIVCGN